jgi:hypothetical protein
MMKREELGFESAEEVQALTEKDGLREKPKEVTPTSPVAREVEQACWP